MTGRESPRAGRICARCEQNPATEKWVGEGGSLALSHGFYEMWCERCVTEVQLEHALERESRIADLQAKLEALGGPAEHVRCGAMAFRIENREGADYHVPGRCGLPKGHGGDHVQREAVTG